MTAPSLPGSEVRANTPTFADRFWRFAQTAVYWEVIPVGSSDSEVYSDGGSGEPTRTERLAGATPQAPRGAIRRGSTSSNAHARKVVRRRVAAQRAQRMGRKVHLQAGRHIPSFFVSSAHDERAAAGPVSLR